MAIYNLELGTVRTTFDEDYDDIWGVSLADQEPKALTIAAPKDFVNPYADYWFLGIWDLRTGKQISRFKIKPEVYISTASDDLKIAMCFQRGEINWWDTDQQECVGSVENPHSRWIFRLTISKDAVYAASLSESGSEVFIWDMANKKTIKSISLPKKGIFSKKTGIRQVRFGANNVYLASVDGKLWVSDPEGDLLEMIVDTGHRGIPYMIDISEKSGLAAFVFWEGQLELWDMFSGKKVAETITGHKGAVTDIRIRPEADSVITAGIDGTVRIWSINEA
jgi:WD40 repeat protein